MTTGQCYIQSFTWTAAVLTGGKWGRVHLVVFCDHDFFYFHLFRLVFIFFFSETEKTLDRGSLKSLEVAEETWDTINSPSLVLCAPASLFGEL